MFRIALSVEYDGTNYYGWQSQKNTNLPTIQQQLEVAISLLANHKVSIICAGRTDAKVHAIFQVLHFDTTVQRKMDSWIFGINSYLPLDIRVLSAQSMPLEFHARRSALYRTYNYFIYNSKIKPSLFRNYITWQYKNLNVDIMQEASCFLVGEHDFRSFRGKDCQSKTTIRNVQNIKCHRQQKLIKISITANAFLKHMVRNIVGVVLQGGQGQDNPSIIKDILLAKDRKAAFITAPPEGLYLTAVGYKEPFKQLIQNEQFSQFARFGFVE